MKKILIAVGFAAQLLIILSFVIQPVFKQLNESIENYGYISIGAMVFIGFLEMMIWLHFTEQRQQQCLDSMRNLLETEAHVEYLSEEEFYSRFLYLLRNEAKENVWITYLDVHPPVLSKYRYKRGYYDELTPLIKESTVKFKRILRATKQNLSWVEKLVEELRGHDNFSLACYRDPDTFSPSVPAVSLQRIDDEHTFIVALAEQEATTKERDIYIKSSKFATYAIKYYQRLWEKSIKIIERGEVKQDKLDELRKLLEQ